MGKNSTLLIAGAAGYLWYTYGRKGVAAKRLEFYPESVDLSHIKINNWIPDLLVRVVNPANVSQTVEAVFLNVYANYGKGDKQFGRIQITTQTTVKKLADTVVKVPIKIFAIGTGTIIAKLIKGETVKFSVKGTVTSMNITIPIDVPLN